MSEIRNTISSSIQSITVDGVKCGIAKAGTHFVVASYLEGLGDTDENTLSQIITFRDPPSRPLTIAGVHVIEWCGKRIASTPPPDCKTCKNEGGSKCDRCNGVGEVECDLGHDHDCRDCDGEGTEECPDCTWSGYLKIEERARVGKLAHVWVNVDFLISVLSMLKGEIAVELRGGMDPIVCRGDGGFGVIMPRSAGPQEDETGIDPYIHTQTA